MSSAATGIGWPDRLVAVLIGITAPRKGPSLPT
jgi:hypothetical protein